MTALPDVPKVDNRAVYTFMQSIKAAIKKLQADLAGLPTATGGTGPINHTAITDFDEAVQDVVGGLLSGGGTFYIDPQYDDPTNTLKLQLMDHPHTKVSDWTEAVQDTVGALLVSGAGISLNYNDAANTLTITATGTGTGGPFTSADITDFTEASQDAIAALLVAGAGVSLAYNDVANTLTITATGGGGAPYGYYGAEENNIKVANAAATNATNLNNLITALAAAGGGVITITTPGNFQINSTIIMKSGVDIRMAPNAYLYWTGAVGGTIVETDPTISIKNLTDTNLNIHSGAGHTGVMFKMHSGITNTIKVRGFGAATTNTFVEINPNWPGPATIIGETNNAFGRYTFHHNETCGRGLYIHGDSTHITTLNTFHDLTVYQGAYIFGCLIDNWCDNNEFDGFTYFNMVGVNSYGLGINSLTPTDGGASGVYQLRFSNLAVDCFGGPLNRAGVIINGSRSIFIDAYFQQPLAEQGPLITADAVSYEIRMFNTSTNGIITHSKGLTTATP